MLKKGFLFGLGLIGAVLLVVVGLTVVVGFMSGYQKAQEKAETAARARPTLEGLKAVVRSKQYDCADSYSIEMTELTPGVWKLECPVETYVITLTRDGDVTEVRRLPR